MKNQDSPPEKPFVDEPPKLELKALPSHLRYVFLGKDSTLPVIIVADLSEGKILVVVSVTEWFKRAIGWTIIDIIGISPGICSHKIQLTPDSKPSIKHQRRLNPPMQECVPKKGKIIVVSKAKKKLVPMRPVTRWRVCIDYRKLNARIEKYHFLMPFMEQRQDRLASKGWYCFLDGYGGDTIDVFMDDFSVAGDSFDGCLMHMAEVLKRYEECHRVFNWEKCHLIVKEGIVLVHWISQKGFYRRFIKDFSKIAHPLCKLLEKELLAASYDLIPWFTNFANYLASDLVASDLSFHQWKKFIYDVKKFYRDEPYLFRVCGDGIIRHCVP
ncbi:uncharacterized protein LOC125855950 [Solanum stenotomum]|uniref:uncharacterized protein LOC125855950 n=1 Tax=Solanum stenotomum TaxID=172797 RepID=UPI0020D01826|nr:uncharacterized protein LOC125855950 [Solanum stenotomum]